MNDLPKTLFSIAFIAGLGLASFFVLRPFLGALIWATMLVVATWPLFVRLEAACRHRWVAVSCMSVALLLLLVLPLWAAIDTLIENSGLMTDAWASLVKNGIPHPPAFVQTLPLFGAKLNSLWLDMASSGSSGLLARVTPYGSEIGKWAVMEAGNVGYLLIQFLLVVVLSAVLYTHGETSAYKLRKLGRRLAGERGDSSVVLAGQAIRGVALGVGVTAIVQTTLGGLGLWIAGVPFAGFLTAAMLMLCIAQIGPALVLFPAVGWMFWSGDTGWGIFLLVISLITVTLDNFLRPVLIKQGADLPLLLIFAGVIGGMLGLGLVGIFIGPVVLAVSYTLMESWMHDEASL